MVWVVVQTKSASPKHYLAYNTCIGFFCTLPSIAMLDLAPYFLVNARRTVLQSLSPLAQLLSTDSVLFSHTHSHILTIHGHWNINFVITLLVFPLFLKRNVSFNF